VEHDAPCSTSLLSRCHRILIVGAGGFGREVLQWALHAWPDEAHKIYGFLSDDTEALSGFDSGFSVVGSAAAYSPVPGEAFVLAIGIPGARRGVAETLVARGAEFLSLVHPTAIVSKSAEVGGGTILCPYSIVSDHCRLGRFVLMNYHSSVGHDASAADFCVFSPYATLGGGAAIGEDVFLGLHASVGPRVAIGDRCKVSAGSVALAAAPADTVIWGSPGRYGRHVEIAP
jgi:sugar O-acyltransferase (sialic acid O-acetyltransferase NeuD family)